MNGAQPPGKAPAESPTTVPAAAPVSSTRAAAPNRDTNSRGAAARSLADRHRSQTDRATKPDHRSGPVRVSGTDGRARLHRRRGRNTFGERLPYLLSPANQDTAERRPSYRHDKKLHVSPFFGLNQSYQWWFSEPGERLDVRIDLSEGGARPFFATLRGSTELGYFPL